jgi:hypothetical protein
VSDSPSKPPVRWTEDRVERLLLKVFGDPAPAVAGPTAKKSPRWSHWALVATCAALLLVVTPILLVPRDADRLAERAADDDAEELVVADASLSDDERSSESSGDESEESSDSESSEDDAST